MIEMPENTKKEKGKKAQLKSAIEKGNLEEAKPLIRQISSINKGYNNISFIQIAIKIGRYKMVELLIKNKADIHQLNILNISALHYAAERGHIEIVELLIENGANLYALSKYKQFPIHCAAENGHIDIVKLLFRKGMDISKINNESNSIIYDAVKNNKYEMIELLIKKGADINKQYVNIYEDHYDFPLISAVKKGCFDIVKLLIEKGANVNIENSDGDFPLIVATKQGELSIAQLLIEKGAEVNKKDSYGESSFYVAINAVINKSERDMFELLVKEDAHLDNIAEAIKNKLLYISIKKMGLDEEIVNYLIRQVNNTKSVLSIAEENGDINVINFLNNREKNKNYNKNQFWKYQIFKDPNEVSTEKSETSSDSEHQETFYCRIM